MIRISLLAIALATPCLAQTTLSPENFEDRVLGKPYNTPLKANGSARSNISKIGT